MTREATKTVLVPCITGLARRRHWHAVVVGIALLGAAPAEAKPVKTNDLTLDVPDTFKVTKSKRGVRLQTQDEEVLVWFETYAAGEQDKVSEEHKKYWKENEVVLNEPTIRDITVPGGAKQESTDFQKATWQGKPTVLRYLSMGPVGTENTVMLYTIWASPEGFRDHSEAVLGILESANLTFTTPASTQTPARDSARVPVAQTPTPAQPSVAQPPASEPTQVAQVDGWDVNPSPGSDGVCAIRYVQAKPQAGGAVPYLSVVYGFDAKVKSRFTAIALEFAGWSWTPGQLVEGATGANDGFLELTDTSWRANNPTGLFVGTTNPDAVLGLLRKFTNLTITDGARQTVFAYTKPDAALAALQPCIGRIQAAP